MSGCYVVFHKQLGDLLLLEPSFARLKAHHGGPVRVMTRRGHRDLLSLMDGVEYLGGQSFAWKSCLYCYDPLNKSAFRALLSPVAHRHCILPEKREMSWIHPLVFGKVIVPELEDKYIAQYFWDNTPVPTELSFRNASLNQPPADWKPEGMGDEPYILANPTSGWRKKSWLAERWVETIKALHEKHKLPIVMTSASTDWQIEQCREIVEQTGSYVRTLGGTTSLKGFLWLCANARMAVTIEGAASHILKAFDVPNLTLFGPSILANWHRPELRHLAIQAAPSKDGKHRMRDLASAAVIEQALSIEI